MKSHMEIIRGLREDNDIKQVDIAKLLGTNQTHYSRYETGEHELPLHALEILADYYKVSTDYLLGRTECKEGVKALNEKVIGDCTMGAFMSDMLSLDAKGRTAVVDYIALQKLSLLWQNGKLKRIKNGPQE